MGIIQIFGEDFSEISEIITLFLKSPSEDLMKKNIETLNKFLLQS